VASSRTLSAPTAWSAEQLAAALRQVTDVPVHTGDELSLGALRRRLTGPLR
jgi:hypothetical protein